MKVVRFYALARLLSWTPGCWSLVIGWAVALVARELRAMRDGGSILRPSSCAPLDADHS